MRLDAAFRLSSYLTLAFASACLGFAAEGVLPGAGILFLSLLLAMAVAFVVESLWPMSARSGRWVGNLGGAAIGLGGAVCFLYLLNQPLTKADEVNEYTYAAKLLPYSGFFLMLLLVLKLFLPKGIRDYWLLFCIGLAMAALASALTAAPVYGFFLAAYLGSCFWFLGHFYLYHQEVKSLAARNNAVRESSNPASGPRRQRQRWPATPWRLIGLPRSARWTLAIMAGGLVLFFLIPQSGGKPWFSFAQGESSGLTGFDEEIDLNPSGEIQLNTNLAFEVLAEDRFGNPHLELTPDQLWRGTTLNWYEDGKWQKNHFGQVIQPKANKLPLLAKGPLPNPGDPRQISFTFKVDPRRTAGLFLANPIMSQPSGNSNQSLRSLMDEKYGVALYLDEKEGILVSQPVLRTGRYQYKQAGLPMSRHAVGPGIIKRDLFQDTTRIPPSPPIKVYTDNLLKKLVEQGKLKPEDLTRQTKPSRTSDQARPTKNLIAENWEKIALQLEDHLTNSGEFTYSLMRRRMDHNVDPTVDFLYNTKEGHCERYATALALMLRSQGVPARVVVGFRGADPQGEGVYQVRQDFAHSWVEALVQRRGDNILLHWMTLDPSPALPVQDAQGFSWGQWWKKTRERGSSMWQDYIANYNTEQQRDIVLGAWKQFNHLTLEPGEEIFPAKSWLPVALVLGSPFLILGWLLGRRRWQNNLSTNQVHQSPSAAFYRKLLEIIARHFQLRPLPAQTPQEFAELAEHLLRSRNVNGSLGSLPSQAAACYYRVRFGHFSLSPGETAEMTKGVADLDAALAQVTPGSQRNP